MIHLSLNLDINRDPANILGLPQPPWFAEGMTPLQWATSQSREESRLAGERDAYELLAAGWMFELPSHDYLDPWQWAWRRPPKRPGKEGRRFASTGQAITAMRKERQ